MDLQCHITVRENAKCNCFPSFSVGFSAFMIKKCYLKDCCLCSVPARTSISDGGMVSGNHSAETTFHYIYFEMSCGVY
jgi:hypothetical protein